jgi:phosphate/phosphite/phosphonate ABC transporter binding protein
VKCVERLVLGLVPSDRLRERDPRTHAFARALGERIGTYVVERNVSSYEELGREMTLAHIDIAWLPPLIFARLERDAIAVAVATRAQSRGTYASVLVAARDSGIERLEHLAGQRIAWVDPLSASGYVVPRLALFVHGLDPQISFPHELFAGSHAEALRAVLEGRADVAATFANLDEDGRVVHGAWSEIGVSAEAVRIVAMLGEIPLDLIAARTSVTEEVRQTLWKALVEMAADAELGAIVESVFGCRRFERGSSASYQVFRDRLERASDAAFGWASDACASTSPPAADER